MIFQHYVFLLSLELQSNDASNDHGIYVEPTQVALNHSPDIENSESATIHTDAIFLCDLTEFFDLLIDNTANNAYRYSIDFTCVPRECGDCGDFMN